MATASSAASATTTVGDAYNYDTETADNKVRAKAVWVRCDSGSAASLQCNIKNLHGDTYVTLAAGEEEEFVAAGGAYISQLRVKTASGTATYSHRITAA